MPFLKKQSDYAILFQNQAYARYFLAVTISRIGTGIKFIALTWLALHLSNSPFAISLILLFDALPGILFSPLLGVIVDRVDKRVLATLINLFQAISLALLPFLSIFHSLPVWVLYLVTFLVSVGEILYRTVRVALIRELVSGETLLMANSTTSVGEQIGLSVGAILAGLSIAWFSTNAALQIYILCLVVGVVFFWRIRKGYLIPSSEGVNKKGWGALLHEMSSGADYTRKHKEIIPIYILMLVFNSTLETINVLLPPFVDKFLRVGSQGFGYIEFSFAVGAVLGGIVLPRLRKKYSDRFLFGAGILSLTGSLIFFSLSTNLWMGILGYFLIGFTYQVWILNLTQAQQSVELNYQGRVHTIFTFFFSIASVGIYFGLGWLSNLISQRWIYGSQGLLIIVVWIIVSVIKRRPASTRLAEN